MKFTRTQKIIRNLLLIALCMFLMAWMWKFPCLTKQGLLNRAEREYLLNGPTELILDREGYFEHKIVYGRNDDGMLYVSYVTTPLGFRVNQNQFFPDSDYLLVQDLDVAVRNGYTGHVYYILLVGLPDHVAWAELDVEKSEKVLLRFETERQEETMAFPLLGLNDKGKEEYWTGNLAWDRVILRLYDDAGNLLQEQTFDDLYYGGNGGGRIP